jgi:hypothetical protein
VFHSKKRLDRLKKIENFFFFTIYPFLAELKTGINQFLYLSVSDDTDTKNHNFHSLLITDDDIG